jgi:hypothetical protein
MIPLSARLFFHWSIPLTQIMHKNWEFLFHHQPPHGGVSGGRAATKCLLWRAVLRNRNYFVRFRFRFRLLTSYGSGSDFWQVTVPVTFPVPAPCLDHQNTVSTIFFYKILPFYIVPISFLQRKNFIKFIVKCQWTNFKIKEIKCSIVYCINLGDSFLLRFRNSSYLWFRFRWGP